MQTVNRRTALSAILTLLVITASSAPLPAQSRGAPDTEAIMIDAAAPAHPFPHFWEQMFGSGRATLALRAAYLRDLRQVKKATGFSYVRFHGIFDDDVGLYRMGSAGHPEDNFSYVDQIYDGLLQDGVRPFVELSFMPRAMASTGQLMGFWYQPIVSPPKDWEQWSGLVERFARHLVDRYGIDEVSQWYFEVWNEPNISFWAGNPKQETYFHLYDLASRALQQVSPRLRVGGPATAQAAWVPQFIDHCVQNHVPVDFVSTHVYGNDSAQNVFHTNEKISREEMVARAVKKVYDEVKASPLPDLPLIFSEFNASYMNEQDVTDSAFMGPWMANTIRQCDGQVKMMSYWTFSDVFEEQGVVKTPFYGGFGLIAEQDIPKASFNDFKLLHMLGTERLAVDSDSALVTRRPDGTLAIAVWNYAPPGKEGPVRTFDLTFKNLSGEPRAYLWVVDSEHGSALTTWKAMGSPRFPNHAQLQILRQAAQLSAPQILSLQTDRLSFKLTPHALALVELVQ